jgi:hypothetical protein
MGTAQGAEVHRERRAAAQLHRQAAGHLDVVHLVDHEVARHADQVDGHARFE